MYRYGLISFLLWENSCLVAQTAYMLGLVFIRIFGTLLAHALRYWQPLTAHSTSIKANITNHLLLSDGSAPASALLAFNHSHLISPFLHCPRKDSLALSDIKLNICCLHGKQLFHISWALISDGDLMSIRSLCSHMQVDECSVWTNTAVRQ